MTTQQLYLFSGLYLAILVVVAVATRATAWRCVGALIGGGVVGVVCLGIIALGEEVGWWHFEFVWEPYFLTLVALGLALSCAAIYLVTWRVARRFGWRGLAVVVLVFAVLGPLRDVSYIKQYPEWGSYGPGMGPVLAIAAMYVLMVVLGHGVMRLVAGTSRGAALARRPWEAADSAATAAPACHVAFWDLKAHRSDQPRD